MEFNWFVLFDKQAFLDTGLVSRLLTLTLEGIGEREVLITLGNELAITYEGHFLPLNFTGKNPYVFEEHAIFEDSNGFIWLGVKKEE